MITSFWFGGFKDQLHIHLNHHLHDLINLDRIPSPPAFSSKWRGTVILVSPRKAATSPPYLPITFLCPLFTFTTTFWSLHFKDCIHNSKCGHTTVYRGKIMSSPVLWWHSIFCWHLQAFQRTFSNKTQGRSWELTAAQSWTQDWHSLGVGVFFPP